MFSTELPTLPTSDRIHTTKKRREKKKRQTDTNANTASHFVDFWTDRKTSSSCIADMAKRSDFAQKLLDDLQVRKERMSASQSSNQMAIGKLSFEILA